jgi:hypothetical protein
MPTSLLLAAIALPTLPVEAVLLLTFAGAAARLACGELGPDRTQRN